MSIQLLPSRSPWAWPPSSRGGFAPGAVLLRAALLAALLLTLLTGCLGGGGSDAPSINTQPRDKAGFVGATVTFDIGVGGKGPLAFQWRRNGVAISGATGGTYTTPALLLGDSGAKYSVVVTNSAGTVTSGDATLTVFGPPTITAQPVAQTVALGATATFNVTASGESITYQWRRNGIAISGANSASYTTAATVAGDDGVEISVDVLNGAGIVGSNGVMLTVTAAPVLVTGPIAQRAAAGERAVFGAVATGGNLQYQWQRGGAPIAGATAATYVTPPLTVADNGAQFAVVITNSQGTLTTASAALSVVTAAVAAPTAPFAEVAAGRSATPAESFTVVKRSNGTVSSWGYAADGQRGDGTAPSAVSDTPSTVTLPSGVVARAVAAGGNHALLLSTTGDVYAWGRNTSGQLGLGDQNPRAVPTKVTLPAAAVSIAAGREFSVAALSDGRVYTWGLNGDGQLGNGSRFSSLTPVEVTGLAGVTAVAAGNSHVLALLGSGTVWAWGANFAGQLGNGRFALSRVPVQGSAVDVVRIRAGGDSSLAITARRTGLAWGENSLGQLGLAGATTNDVPFPVGVLNAVVDGSAADTLTLFVGADGLLRTAGSNETGSLGDGSSTARNTYGTVNSVSNAIAAAVGGRSFGLVVRSDGALLSWGDNTGDQLGNSTLAATGVSTATVVPGFSAGP